MQISAFARNSLSYKNDKKYQTVLKHDYNFNRLSVLLLLVIDSPLAVLEATVQPSSYQIIKHCPTPHHSRLITSLNFQFKIGQFKTKIFRNYIMWYSQAVQYCTLCCTCTFR